MTALSELDGRRVVLAFTDGGDDPGPGKHVSYGTVLKRAQGEKRSRSTPSDFTASAAAATAAG